MLVAIVPVKSPQSAKSRLSGVLSESERRQLCTAMLHDVLSALRQTAQVDHILVTSPSAQVAAEAHSLGANFLLDRPETLNGAVGAALEEAVRRGASMALVLPGDVPLITPADVARLVQRGERPGSVVVAPTGDRGTGALLLHPPTLISPDYGGASAPRHLAAARSAGARAIVAALPNLALDLDRPEDLWSFWRLGRPTSAHRFLQQLGRERCNQLSPGNARKMG